MVRTRSGKVYGGDEGQRQTRSFGRSSEPEQGPSKRANQSGSSKVKENEPGVLQQILEERKAVSKSQAEKRRQEGLEKIQERNSKTGVDPLSLFPKEIWLEIVNELTPGDKASVWEVHPLYRGLMEGDRIGEILFPQILDHKTGFVERYFHPHTFFPVLVKLRQVSRIMRDAVDKWFEDAFDNLETVKDPSMYHTRQTFSLEMSFSFSPTYLDQILRIQRPMRIPQRELDIEILGQLFRDDDMRQEYFSRFQENVTRALEQIGDRFWRFVLYCENIDVFGVSRTQVYTFLNELLHRLPNLKFIDVCFNNLEFQEDGSERIDESLLSRQPFPNLTALEGVRFHSLIESELFPICDGIIASNPHVKSFSFWQNGKDFDYFMSQPRVQSLELESCMFSDTDYSKILKAPRCNWNLKRIDIDELPDGSTLSDLFNFLNHFPTLEILFLEDVRIIFGTEPVDYLRLPNLRHFGIVISSVDVDQLEYRKDVHFFMSLQFLIHSSNLQSILWFSSERLTKHLRGDVKKYERKNPGTMLDFGGGFEDLTSSNLWQAFPSLERIHVKIEKRKNEVYRRTRSLTS